MVRNSQTQLIYFMNSLCQFADDLNLWDINGFSLKILSSILADSSKFYRCFDIPKRKGGKREINAPYPILGQIQKSLLKVLESKDILSPSSFAYRRGSNAIQHAAVHLGCRELLTVDIENFFGSTSRQRVYEALLNIGFSNDFTLITSFLTTHRGVLPQGSPTSPILSNMVFHSLDDRLIRLANCLNLTYTRYADDLVFSGNYIPRNLVSSIEGIISSKGYTLNNSKSILKTQGVRKIITGVSISSGKLKPPRNFVRSLRSDIYNLEKTSGNLASSKSIDPLIYERILGKLNYWLQIEPDNNYVVQKKQILSELHQKFLDLSNNFSLDNYASAV